jgi:hypothetical protein
MFSYVSILQILPMLLLDFINVSLLVCYYNLYITFNYISSWDLSFHDIETSLPAI